MSFLDTLTRRVPPPSEPVHSGARSDWQSLSGEYGLELPADMVDISCAYGSGAFCDGDFWLSIHSVFRPRFDLLVRYNEMLFRSLAKDDPDSYMNIFEIGGYGFGDEQGAARRIFWDTRGPIDEWKIGFSSSNQRLSLHLVEFLARLFNNEFAIDGFPKTFSDVRFSPAEWD